MSLVHSFTFVATVLLSLAPQISSKERASEVYTIVTGAAIFTERSLPPVRRGERANLNWLDRTIYRIKCMLCDVDVFM